MLDDDDFNAEFDQKTPMQRFGLPVGAVLLLAVVGVGVFFLMKGGVGPSARPHNEPHITQVQLPPPPPPPPPPPKTPPPPRKPEETPKQREPTPQKAVSKPAPKAPSPPAALTTSIQGNGPGSLAFGNGGGGGGDCIGAGCGTGDGTGGDNDAYYSDLVKTRIEDALRRDEKLRFAKFRVTISISLESSGGFGNASVASFSGDDDARDEVERVIRATSTGDTPAASVIGKQFLVRISERARG